MEVKQSKSTADKQKWWAEPDLNWRPFDYQTFQEWIHKKEYVESYQRRMLQYAKQYGECLKNGDYSNLSGANNHRDKLAAVANLAKYLGKYDEFRSALKKWGIKWGGFDTAFKGFLNVISNRHENLPAYIKVLCGALLPNEVLFIEFLAVTGLRPGEGVMAFNKLVTEGTINYYNEELQCLEHYKYPKLFLRRTKKSYISFVPQSLVERICQSLPVNYNRLQCYLKRAGVPLQLKQLRSYHNSTLYKAGVQGELIDILAGRVPKSVFVRHYLNVNLQQLSGQILAIESELLMSLYQ